MDAAADIGSRSCCSTFKVQSTVNILDTHISEYLGLTNPLSDCPAVRDK